MHVIKVVLMRDAGFLKGSVVVGTIRFFMDASYDNDGQAVNAPVILTAKKTGNPYTIINFKPDSEGSVAEDGIKDLTSGYNLSIFNVESILKDLRVGDRIAIDASEFDFLKKDDDSAVSDDEDEPSPFKG